MKAISKYISALIILSIWNGNNLNAQNVTSNFISDKLNDYYQKYHQERLFVHTDKDFYLAGDLIWFKIYHIDNNTDQPVLWSKVAYVELIDHNNVPVWQSKISLKPNEDNGSCFLPFNLATGYYRFRAYTNWMKNSGAEIFFEKRIAIVNSLKDPEKNFNSTATYHVDFFPEGGNLVNGIQTQLAFHVTDITGKGISSKGYIITDKNDTIRRFETLKFGIGKFSFTPIAGVGYKAIIKLDDGTELKRDLPKIYDQGYVLNVSLKDSGQMLVTIHSNGTEGNNELIYLIAQSKDKIRIAEKLFLNNNAAQLVVDRKNLGEGIARLTLFNNKGQPLCERLVFNRPVVTNVISIAPESEAYAIRKKVVINANLIDTSLIRPGINLSASVFRIDSLQENSLNIVDYYWLTSELTGKVESSDYYLNNSNKESDEALDNLMLTHGWRKFNWNKVFQENSTAVKFPMEYKGHIITARVTDSRSGQPASRIQLFLSIPGRHFQFFSGLSDSIGLVRFDVKHLYGSNEMVFQTNTQKDSFYHVEIVNPFSENFAEDSTYSFRVSESKIPLLEDYHIAMQARNIYSADSLRIFNRPMVSDTLPFYGKASVSYELDNYTRFTTIEEILREYVTEINVGVRSGQKFIKILHENEKEFATEDILVLLDGIALMDRSKIFSYDPLKIRKLDIITENYILGPSNFSGIASFVTYNGNFQGYELDPRDITIDYEGLQLQREFYSPSYDNP
ncbi:MAG: hypothetical protein ACJ748_10725, partial [Flavisolibacter sp.]